MHDVSLEIMMLFIRTMMILLLPRPILWDYVRYEESQMAIGRLLRTHIIEERTTKLKTATPSQKIISKWNGNPCIKNGGGNAEILLNCKMGSYGSKPAFDVLFSRFLPFSLNI